MLTASRSQHLHFRRQELCQGAEHPEGPCGGRHGRRVLPHWRGARERLLCKSTVSNTTRTSANSYVGPHHPHLAPRPGPVARHLPHQAHAEGIPDHVDHGLQVPPHRQRRRTPSRPPLILLTLLTSHRATSACGAPTHRSAAASSRPSSGRRSSTTTR